MEILVAKSAGFCFGVGHAVKTAYDNVGKGKFCTFGSIIHNRIVTDDLEKKGIRIVHSIDEIEDETVLIRAHGVPASVYKELESRGIPYIDCTCRDVKRIHGIVQKSGEEGRRVIIIGSADHPEIKAIAGFCDKPPIIIECLSDVAKLIAEISGNIPGTDKENQTGKAHENGKFSLVVQTTFVRSDFEKILDEIKKINLDINIYDTICGSTARRLSEAKEISAQVDYMLVIGDKNSANTSNLYNTCKENCRNTFFIESISDLRLNIFSSNDKIGVTAGASTPPVKIEEAVNVMSEINNEKANENFEEMLNGTLFTLHKGEIVKGTVISIANGEVSVNLGYKSDGIIARNEFSDDPSIIPENVLKKGDEITVQVLRVNDSEGTVLLSKKKVDDDKNSEEIEKAFKEKTPIKARVIEVVKGGLMAAFNGTKLFVPSSQVSNRYVENLSGLVGKEFNFNIIEYDRQKKRIIAGRKELAVKEQQEKREKVFSSLEIGQQINGTVSRVVDFGAFIDLGGVDGLVHISELSWGRVKKVTDVLNVGDSVVVTVLDIDKDKDKISLTLKDIRNNPWSTAAEKYAIGNVVSGKVVRIVTFGAFIELEPGIDGLLHISQIADKHVTKPENELSIGETISVKVTEIDVENKKISLSKKAVDGIMNDAPSANDEEVPAADTVKADVEVPVTE